MASKYKINRSNYTIKSRHQLLNKGVVYERDFMTTTNLGGWDSGSIPYGEGNFRMFYRPKENARKKPRPGFWLKPSCENSDNYWTEDCVSTTGLTEGDLINIKTTHHTLLDFAYFGSCEELIKSTIRKVLETYPGYAYAKAPDKVTIKNDKYYYFENAFDIDLFGDGFGTGCKDFLKTSGACYEVAVNEERFAITGVDIIRYDACNYGDKIATLKITSNDGIKEIYKIIDGPKRYGTYTSSDFAIVPNESAVEEFFEGIDDFTKVLLDRGSDPIYTAELDWPHETDYGIMTYRRKITWPTTENGCIDGSSLDYEKYVNELLDLARFYDEKYTNNLWRMLTHDSIKNMDLTFSNPSKDEDVEDYNIGTTRMEGLLWAFGRQFDEIKRRIDGIKHAINVSYDSDNNLPDYFLSDTLENSGWDVSNVDNGLDNETAEISWEAGKPRVYSAAEANNLFLKNLKLNAKSILKKKGTREGIANLLSLFGLSENDETYGFTISEEVYTIMGDIEHVDADEEFELARLNSMKLSMIDGSREEEGFNEFDGLPFTYVENEDSKYIIPWFDRNLHYDGGAVFQSKGGWAKKDILKTFFEKEYNSDGESNYTYDESIKNITVIDTISELSAITQSRVYNGSVCYVDDISELGDYFYELSTHLTEDDTFFHYFILVDEDKFDVIGENGGWVCAADGLPEVTEYRDKIILMESVIESYEANNPHNGYWQYDGGETFIERIRNPFGYHIEEQNKGNDIFGDDAFDCGNGLIPDFEEYAAKVNISTATDNKKVWFFKGETKNTSTSQESSTPQELPYDVYDFEADKTGKSLTESSANAIINSKVMRIEFTVLSSYTTDFRTYFEASILPYLKQMVPSTTIWGYQINGEGKVPADKKCMIIFKTTPSDATVTIAGGTGTYNNGRYIGKWGEEISYTVSATNYHSKTGTVRLNGNKTVTVVLQPVTYTLQIITDPTNATVILNGVTRNTITVGYGTRVRYEVSAEWYETATGEIVITASTSERIILTRIPNEDLPSISLTIVPTPDDAQVVINGVPGKYYVTKPGTAIHYSVKHPWYDEVEEDFIINEKTVLQVSLNRKECWVIIQPDPKEDVAVKINGETIEYKDNIPELTGETETWGYSTKVLMGSVVEWSAAKTDFQGRHGSERIEENPKRINFKLTPKIVTVEVNTSSPEYEGLHYNVNYILSEDRTILTREEDGVLLVASEHPGDSYSAPSSPNVTYTSNGYTWDPVVSYSLLPSAGISNGMLPDDFRLPLIINYIDGTSEYSKYISMTNGVISTNLVGEISWEFRIEESTVPSLTVDGYDGKLNNLPLYGEEGEARTVGNATIFLIVDENNIIPAESTNLKQEANSIINIGLGNGVYTYNNGNFLPDEDATYAPYYKIPLVVTYTNGSVDDSTYYLGSEGNNLPITGASVSIRYTGSSDSTFEINENNGSISVTGGTTMRGTAFLTVGFLGEETTLSYILASNDGKLIVNVHRGYIAPGLSSNVSALYNGQIVPAGSVRWSISDDSLAILRARNEVEDGYKMSDYSNYMYLIAKEGAFGNLVIYAEYNGSRGSVSVPVNMIQLWHQVRPIENPEVYVPGDYAPGDIEILEGEGLIVRLMTPDGTPINAEEKVPGEKESISWGLGGTLNRGAILCALDGTGESDWYGSYTNHDTKIKIYGTCAYLYDTVAEGNRNKGPVSAFFFDRRGMPGAMANVVISPNPNAKQMYWKQINDTKIILGMGEEEYAEIGLFDAETHELITGATFGYSENSVTAEVVNSGDTLYVRLKGTGLFNISGAKPGYKSPQDFSIGGAYAAVLGVMAKEVCYAPKKDDRAKAKWSDDLVNSFKGVDTIMGRRIVYGPEYNASDEMHKYDYGEKTLVGGIAYLAAYYKPFHYLDGESPVPASGGAYKASYHLPLMIHVTNPGPVGSSVNNPTPGTGASYTMHDAYVSDGESWKKGRASSVSSDGKTITVNGVPIEATEFNCNDIYEISGSYYQCKRAHDKRDGIGEEGHLGYEYIDEDAEDYSWIEGAKEQPEKKDYAPASLRYEFKLKSESDSSWVTIDKDTGEATVQPNGTGTRRSAVVEMRLYLITPPEFVNFRNFDNNPTNKFYGVPPENRVLSGEMINPTGVYKGQGMQTTVKTTITQEP